MYGNDYELGDRECHHALGHDRAGRRGRYRTERRRDSDQPARRPTVRADPDSQKSNIEDIDERINRLKQRRTRAAAEQPERRGLPMKTFGPFASGLGHFSEGQWQQVFSGLTRSGVLYGVRNQMSVFGDSTGRSRCPAQLSWRLRSTTTPWRRRIPVADPHCDRSRGGPPQHGLEDRRLRGETRLPHDQPQRARPAARPTIWELSLLRTVAAAPPPSPPPTS